MSFAEIILLSFALAIDAMLVSFSYGLIINQNRLKYACMLSIAFGFFQFLMPLLGYQFSVLFYDLLETYSKWVVFVIFMILGLKFLKEAFEEKDGQKICTISVICLLSLAVATSIDAFGAGVSLKFSGVNIIKSSVIIGIITALTSILGFYLTRICKNINSKYLSVAGALILILLSVKSIL
ncbi:MAG: manganese efflux pump MntP family protein [Candidatus Gastranaerophilales bacterium]|nr:manganese efflux pump MntP family protein [Candidatus Gastranaerophilales bacterium]